MMTWRIAALLLVINTVVFLLGILVGGSSLGGHRPSWLPPVWLRAMVPIAVAAGLWFGYRSAWWVAVVMCAALILWFGFVSLPLASGDYFKGDGAVFRTLHFGLLLATWLAVLACLLSIPKPLIGDPNG